MLLYPVVPCLATGFASRAALISWAEVKLLVRILQVCRKDAALFHVDVVRQARGHVQQPAHRHRRGVRELFGKVGQNVSHRVVEGELALVDQLQDRCAGGGLGHRPDVHVVLVGDRLAVLAGRAGGRDVEPLVRVPDPDDVARSTVLVRGQRLGGHIVECLGVGRRHRGGRHLRAPPPEHRRGCAGSP